MTDISKGSVNTADIDSRVEDYYTLLCENKTPFLMQYVKNNKHQKIGVIVAVSPDQVGWSKCHTSIGDKFVKGTGIRIALKRALLNRKHTKDNIPSSIKPFFERMEKSAVKYYNN